MLFTKDHCVSTERIWEGTIINLRVDTLDVDNTLATREVVEHNGGVVIAGMTKEDKVVLVKQYRYSIDRELIELPAGRIEAGEDPYPAAQRELTEETGYHAENWQELSRMYSAPGFCNEIIYIYLAENLTYKGKNLDFDEETEVIELTLTEAWAMVHNGQIQDAKTIAGLGLLSQRAIK